MSLCLMLEIDEQIRMTIPGRTEAVWVRVHKIKGRRLVTLALAGDRDIQFVRCDRFGDVATKKQLTPTTL